MADKKISQLVGAATPLDGTEVLPIVKSGSTVKVANNDLRPKQIQSNATSGVLQVVGPTAVATRVMTVPDANFTAARTDAAQTFTGNQVISAGALEVSSASAGVTVGDLFVDTANKIVYVGRQSSTGGDASSFIVRGRQGTAAFQVDPGNPSITASADLTMSNANLVIGTSGKGIDFSATGQATGMTSELLADYEEGTFTPTAGIALTSASGKYTKVGRAVHFVIEAVFPVTVSTAGAGFGGLPFTASANNYPCAVWTNRGSTIFAYVVASSADVNLFNVTTGGIYDYIDFSADSVKIAGTYFV